MNLFEGNLNTIKLVHKYLGEHAFSSFSAKSGQWTKISNRSLYNAEMLAFSGFINKGIPVTPEKFKQRLETLMMDKEFRRSLHSQAGGTMMQYLRIYNHHIPQKNLSHTTPVEALKNWRKTHPDLFKKQVYNQSGLDTY